MKPGTETYIFAAIILVFIIIIIFPTNANSAISDFDKGLKSLPSDIKKIFESQTVTSITGSTSAYTIKSISPNIIVYQNDTNKQIVIDFIRGAVGSGSQGAQGIQGIQGTNGTNGINGTLYNVFTSLPLTNSTTDNNITIFDTRIEYPNSSVLTKEPVIPLALQDNKWYRGDKTWQTIVLGNINGWISFYSQLYDIDIPNLQNNDTQFNQSILQLQQQNNNYTGTYPIIVTGGATRTISIDPRFDNIRMDYIQSNVTTTTGIDLLLHQLYLYAENASINFTTSGIKLLQGTTGIDIFDNLININAGSNGNVNLTGIVNVNGTLLVNSKNIETELTKTSIKSFQADYTNASQIYSDIILIPQDLNLTNISTVITKTENSTGFILNFSLEKYTNYDTGTTQIIVSESLTSSTNYIDSLNYSFNNKDILLLNYTTYQNVSKASSMFKFKVR